MVLRMKNFNILGVHWKIWLLGGVMKSQYRGVIAEKGGLRQFADLRGAWQERGWCFWGEIDSPMDTM